ncbi:MAG: hypothetical protein RLZZ143_1771 [Cyanobacteriota bacterium]
MNQKRYIVANSISLKKYEAIKIIFIRVDSLTRKTFGLEIILGRGLLIVLLSVSFLFEITRSISGGRLLRTTVSSTANQQSLEQGASSWFSTG